jgi:glutamyl-tRNA synthetase
MASGRFAPSPSGTLHLGNLRTALLAWLFARSADSRFQLRIEDLDPDRSRVEHERAQLADLEAVGLDWDGPPVRQSDRTELYRLALHELDDAGLVYPCWCTRAEIRAAAKAPHGQHPEGAYPGTCRDMSDAERKRRHREAGRPPSMRLHAAASAQRQPSLQLDTEAAVVGFEDRLHGWVEREVDDFVLWRWDDTPAYNLAVVVDDADQHIGEVVRGDDLLDSTPRQLLLCQLLNMPVPTHAHVPLVLGPDGARLAKRHGAVTLADRVALGETPADVVAWMAASVGLCEPGERPTSAQLIDRFDPATLPREPTVLTS